VLRFGLIRLCESLAFLSHHSAKVLQAQMTNLKINSAGKFILIKLWAPSQNSNIDIQSIVAHGFAGPRYFPSLEFQ
jgi:hypothetical protein